MSEWIKLHAGVFTHPKTRRLAKRLSIPPAAAAGHMACLWSFTAEFAPDGDLSRFDAEEVELGAGWDGEEGAFVTAATAAGYLESSSGRLTVHDWMDWGGTLITKKAKELKRSADRREAASSGAYEAVKIRDGEACRYCGKVVNWNDRRSDDGATYDHVDPDGATSIENLVVACRGCNSSKGHRSPSQAGMTLIVVGSRSTLIGPSTDLEQTKADREIDREIDRETEQSKNTVRAQGALVCSEPVDNLPAEDNSSTYSDDFEAFWAAYPRKDEKRKAWRAWNARLKKHVAAAGMTKAAANYAAGCQGAERRFIKLPATFIGPDMPFTDWVGGVPAGCVPGNGKGLTAAEMWAELNEGVTAP